MPPSPNLEMVMEMALTDHSDLLEDADRGQVLRATGGLGPVQAESAETEVQDRGSGLGGKPVATPFGPDNVAHVGVVGTVCFQFDRSEGHPSGLGDGKCISRARPGGLVGSAGVEEGPRVARVIGPPVHEGGDLRI